MLATLISKYLESNRRLVIPQFGAILVKNPGHQLLFSPLLTRDDGVLRQLIMESGISEVEATGMIDRLLFDIRYALDAKESYLIEGVCRFVKDQTDTIQLITVHQTSSPVENKLTPPQDQDDIEVEVKPQTETEEISQREVVATVEPQRKEPSQTRDDQSKEDATIEELPPEAPAPAKLKLDRSLFEPDPDLEGLSYGNSRTKSRATRQINKRKGVDLWLVLAIVVAAIALTAILYGFLREGAGSSISDHYSEQQY
ncbi:MAG: hypothetical protein SNH18_09780 [Rikenellaceae bacterium]